MSDSTIARFQALLDQLDDPYPALPMFPSAWDSIKAYRPCIDRMVSACGVPQGTRNRRIFRIASEYRRRGLGIGAGLAECERVNRLSFKCALRSHEVRDTVRSAFKKPRVFACYDSLLQSYCVGHESCAFCRSTGDRRMDADLGEKEAFERDWKTILQPNVFEVYLWLMVKEASRGLSAGSKFSASEREIASGCRFNDHGTAGRALRVLIAHGLIRKIHSGIGGSSKATGFASQFQRVTPLPKPTVSPGAVRARSAEYSAEDAR